MSIHPTAIVDEKAQLAQDVAVGPYTVIGPNVAIAGGTVIGSHCVIDGNTSIGESCEIFTGAVIGSRPQDLKYKGAKSFLEIGDHNVIREYCTLNPGTEEGGKTVMGSRNLLMAYCHIAHDCLIGNDAVIANNGTLAGHVTIEDMAVIGGIVAIHQFVRVGRLSIIGGCSKVVQDIPPFSTCDGHPARVYGLNLVGLRRHNVGKDCIHEIDQAFKVLFNSGFSLRHALERLEQEKYSCAEIAYLVQFAKNSQRGLSRSCRTE
ncbi:MAG TPA: acyl-ACP--UDP-N-acetylglucosamine O-acyltransferase [Patescibacteria group bacterium]|nr:acyl-ACP--UDP-N-acetylglucosamine O-acyltransferase [Patescibacteria group bacterium]